MKKLLIVIIFILFSTNLYAEFILEPIICTTKKTSNCGAYIYNTRTGEVYFCDSKECKEVKTPIEIFIDEEEEDESLIPKKPKKKESKIPKKPKKKESKIPKKPDKCKKNSKIPKPGCT